MFHDHDDDDADGDDDDDDDDDDIACFFSSVSDNYGKMLGMINHSRHAGRYCMVVVSFSELLLK